MVISKTPLRVSFFGGGTDFKGYYETSEMGHGEVLSTTIDMYVYITVLKKFDDSIRVCYSKNEIVESVDDIQHNIIREALKMAGISKGVEIIYTADLPLGTAGVGMASSSAIAVGTLNALYAYQGIYLSPDQLAHMACELEIEKLGNPIGIQDQYAVAFGGFRRYRFYPEDKVSTEPIFVEHSLLERLKSSLLLFYTGMTRNSAIIMREQNDTIEEKRKLLDSMVVDAEKAFRDIHDGNIDEWGKALHQGWLKKKNFAGGVSNPTIDDMYERAVNAGALGGKILGAGGGGFMLLYVPDEKKEMVRTALREFREIDFSFEPCGSNIIFYD